MSLTKKIVLAIGILLLVVVAYVSYVMVTASAKSPAAVENYHQPGISMKIEYCRPYKRERLIFGTAEEGALQPFGKYWRLGANDATKLTLDTDVIFGDQPLDKGSYSLYAFPGKDHWVIGINSEADRSGSNPPDFSKDIGRVKVPVTTTTESQDQFKISISQSGSEAIVSMHWDTTLVKIPVRPAD